MANPEKGQAIRRRRKDYCKKTDRDILEGLEGAFQPDIDGGANGGGLTIEGVRHH